jgi:hypothetical protein
MFVSKICLLLVYSSNFHIKITDIAKVNFILGTCGSISMSRVKRNVLGRAVRPQFLSLNFLRDSLVLREVLPFTAG